MKITEKDENLTTGPIYHHEDHNDLLLIHSQAEIFFTLAYLLNYKRSLQYLR